MPTFTRLAMILGLLFLAPTSALSTGEISTDKLVIQAKIPRGGDFMAFGFDSLWMMSNSRLVRVNPADNSFVEIKVPRFVGNNRGIAVSDSAVWIPNTGSGTLFKVDPSTNQVVEGISLDFFDSEGSIGAGEGAVWMVAFDEKARTVLKRINTESGAVEADIPLDSGSISAVVDFGSVWVTNNSKDALYRIDPKTNSVASVISLGKSPRFLASGEEAIWVLNQQDGTVQRIDPRSEQVIATIKVGGSHGGGDIAVGGGYVWVTLRGFPVIKIDPKTNMVVRTFKGFGMGDAIRFGANSVWVSGLNIFRIQPPE